MTKQTEDPRARQARHAWLAVEEVAARMRKRLELGYLITPWEQIADDLETIVGRLRATTGRVRAHLAGQRVGTVATDARVEAEKRLYQVAQGRSLRSVEKAIRLVVEGSVDPEAGTVRGDSDRVYDVDLEAESCTCQAAEHGKKCSHELAMALYVAGVAAGIELETPNNI